jgi:predicted glycoside hydrolase/deacetylase ChbG (UPF0249 family)
MSRVLMLCADDFGLSGGISRGIARLARAGRLNATSCITNAPEWRHQAPLLADLPDTVDVGLHFNLTEGAPLSTELRRVWPRLPALPQLILRAHLRALPRAAIAAELAAQWAAFADATGRAPAFVDGHQHVHHLPQVREVLLAALQSSPATAVRNTGRVLGPGFGVKRALIAGTGGRTLQRRLARRALRHNPALLGVYDFADGADYRGLMQGWLARVAAEGALLFCHPGDPDAGVPDAIAAARPREAAYLASPELAADLAAAGVVLGRVW